MNKIKGVVGVIVLAILPAVAVADTVEKNKAVAARMFREILSEGHFEVAAEIYAPDFVNHGLTRDVDLAVDQAAAKGWRMAAPDMITTPEMMVSEGDLVAVYWKARGTNTGEGNGLPATGRSMEGHGMTIWRVVNGRFQEEWSAFSELLIMQKLGLRNVAPAIETESTGKLPDNSAQVSQAELEKNRRVARMAVEQILGEGQSKMIDSLYSKDYRNHGTWGTATAAQDADHMRELGQLAPDLNAKVQLTIAEGDRVAVLYTVRGTHTAGANGDPAIGKKFLIRGISILRLQDGKIVEEWSELDRYEALDQMGLLPPPVPTGK